MIVEETIRNYYQAFNAKNWGKMLNFLSDDVVHDINQGPKETGKQAFTNFLESMNTHYSEHLEDIVVMTSTDKKRAAAEFICKGTYLKSAEGLPAAHGQTYRLPVGAFFELNKDGKISRISNYYNLPDWIKQVS